MWHFLLPAFAMMGALLVLFAGALSNLQSLPGLSDRDVALVGDPAPRRMPPPSSSPSSLPAEQSPAPAAANQQATRDALQRQIDDLLRQGGALQVQIAQHKQELAQRPVERPPPPATADQQATRDALQRQVDDLRRQGSSLQAGITDLQRQDSALQGQIAQHKQELSQRTAEAGRPRQPLNARGVTHFNIRWLICSGRLPICSSRTVPSRARLPNAQGRSTHPGSDAALAGTGAADTGARPANT